MNQLFTVLPKAGGYLISDGDINNALYVAQLAAMRQLYDQIGALLSAAAPEPAPAAPTPEPEPAPDMLSSFEAIAYAAADGLDLPLTTLNSACTRNSLRGAVKEHAASHSRWQIPRDSFLHWYATWSRKARNKANA